MRRMLVSSPFHDNVETIVASAWFSVRMKDRVGRPVEQRHKLSVRDR